MSCVAALCPSCLLKYHPLACMYATLHCHASLTCSDSTNHLACCFDESALAGVCHKLLDALHPSKLQSCAVICQTRSDITSARLKVKTTSGRGASEQHAALPPYRLVTNLLAADVRLASGARQWSSGLSILSVISAAALTSSEAAHSSCWGGVSTEGPASAKEASA